MTPKTRRNRAVLKILRMNFFSGSADQRFVSLVDNKKKNKTWEKPAKIHMVGMEYLKNNTEHKIRVAMYTKTALPVKEPDQALFIILSIK